MHTSLVILWWGCDLRLLGPGGRLVARDLAEGTDPVPALLELADRERLGSATARIVYHPDGLEAHDIVRPKAGRRRLRRILASEFPGLGEADAVWTVAPRSRRGGSEEAVLYLEARSRLPQLVAGLARLGLRAEGAWPLAALLEAAPLAGRESPAALAAIATARRAFISADDGEGGRFERFHRGLDCAESAATDLTAAAALMETRGGGGLAAIEDGPKNASLREAARGHELTEASLADFLARAHLLRPGGFPDFLRPRPWLARRTALTAAAAALGLILLAGSIGRVRAAGQRAAVEQRSAAAAAARHRDLEGEVARRRALRDRIARLKEELAPLRCPPQRHYDFLLALASAAPDSIWLRRVVLQGNRFLVAGRIYHRGPGSGGELAAFLRELPAHGRSWISLDPPDRTPPDPAAADFSIGGVLGPPSPIRPGGLSPCAP